MVKILVAGFKGRMGNTTVKMVLEHTGFELAAVFDPRADEKNINEIAEFSQLDVPVYRSLAEIDCHAIDVWIDLLRLKLYFLMRNLLCNIKFHQLSEQLAYKMTKLLN